MRVLIAIHDPTNTEQMLRFAVQFAHLPNHSSATLVIVVEPHKGAEPDDTPLLAMAGKILDLPPSAAHLRAGDLYQEVLAEIEENGCGLLIVGEDPPQHGLSFWRGEGVIQKLVQRVSCPVMVVKGPARRVRRILLCDSGAENSVLNRFTAQLAELLEGDEEVTVLHVMSQISAGPGVPDAQLHAGAAELIEQKTPEGKLLWQDIQALDRPGIHPQAKIRHGLVVDEILAEARVGDYDLVVIGAHREQGWLRFLLDDLAHQILTKIDRPVLVVR